MPKAKAEPQLLRVAPVIRRFFEIVQSDARSYDLIAHDAGLNRATIIRWQHNTSPNLNTFTAACNALGYDVIITPVGGGANNTDS